MEIQQNSSVPPSATKQASWWALVVVAFILGILVGYYLGAKGVGSGLISDENNDQESLPETSQTSQADAPTNPFEDEEYQNPFENLQVNPFE